MLNWAEESTVVWAIERAFNFVVLLFSTIGLGAFVSRCSNKNYKISQFLIDLPQFTCLKLLFFKLMDFTFIGESHYFVVIIRHEGQMVVSQMVSSAEATIVHRGNGYIEIPNMMQFMDLQPDFSLVMEIFSMVC